ncbi:MAG: YbaK/EbsC family protein [Atopobiaceae bacterium]|jgi:prolyl-tRNA editing enzyme YbaK/EbsC (Cys-tRNA(Pro) deacylase)|nr:YbaK/EbsC family protein [Atopobiaceae bacterium]MCI2174070.1 YbaK/EbsC family protein [Atopobiaceae bacterium]MCI2207840.1 YbaK/EbsC family protein [Atopobiaceae bacterium]
MAIDKVRDYLDGFGMGPRIREFDSSSATVELAAEAVGVEPARIAKTLSFLVGGSPILVVCAGDAKVDNKAYKATFSCKAKMIPADEVEGLVGHAVGGVCPFAVADGVVTYLDESLRRFDEVWPACGSANSAIGLTLDELEHVGASSGWVDVCKGWREEVAGA